MAKKIRDIVVKVGSYQDRNTGEEKARWKNVGALMKNDDDDSLFIMLERTFNPAGVPNQDGRESVLLSCFVPQDRQQNGQGNQQQNQQNNGQSSQGGGNGNQGGGAPYDDEVPFAPEWRI